MCIHFHVMFLLIYLVCPCRQQRKHRLVVCAKKVETKKNSVWPKSFFSSLFVQSSIDSKDLWSNVDHSSRKCGYHHLLRNSC